jgi:hypothetical protein
MNIVVFFDNNVWDFLFVRQLDLAVQLPQTEFRISITREAEFEIAAIPAHKALLKEFIANTLARRPVRTDAFFGFYDKSLPASEQRMAPFNSGRFAERSESHFMADQNARPRSRKKNPKTGLYAHEADISLATRSLRYVVLTLDEAGALKDAHKQGGRVIYLAKFDPNKMSLGQFIKAELSLS